MKFKLAYFLCYLDLHKYKVIDIKFGFGNSGKIMTVQCKNCGIIQIKKGD